MLRAQENAARGEAVGAMKAEGIEYEERMELLEEITWPKPLAELLEPRVRVYRKGHPWVGDAELSPKSVVRDMYERAMNFVEFVSHYKLARSEGLVLRYLTDAYRALRQTIPETRRHRGPRRPHRLARRARPPDRLVACSTSGRRSPTPAELDAAGSDAAPIDQGPPPVTRNERAFRVLVRNEMFRRVELVRALAGPPTWPS